MKRNIQSGKAKFSSILIVAIIFYAGFYLFKLISANMTPGQVENEITNAIGVERGPSFTIAKGEKIVRDALERHGVLESINADDRDDVETVNPNVGREAVGEHQSIIVELDEKTTTVRFYADFHVTVDFFFFKQIKYYEVEGVVINYN